jgi:hypothetical protein
LRLLHIVFTYKTGEANIYVNGVSVAATKTSTTGTVKSGGGNLMFQVTGEPTKRDIGDGKTSWGKQIATYANELNILD